MYMYAQFHAYKFLRSSSLYKKQMSQFHVTFCHKILASKKDYTRVFFRFISVDECHYIVDLPLEHQSEEHYELRKGWQVVHEEVCIHLKMRPEGMITHLSLGASVCMTIPGKAFYFCTFAFCVKDTHVYAYADGSGSNAFAYRPESLRRQVLNQPCVHI